MIATCYIHHVPVTLERTHTIVSLLLALSTQTIIQLAIRTRSYSRLTYCTEQPISNALHLARTPKMLSRCTSYAAFGKPQLHYQVFHKSFTPTSTATITAAMATQPSAWRCSFTCCCCCNCCSVLRGGCCCCCCCCSVLRGCCSVLRGCCCCCCCCCCLTLLLLPTVAATGRTTGLTLCATATAAGCGEREPERSGDWLYCTRMLSVGLTACRIGDCCCCCCCRCCRCCCCCCCCCCRGDAVVAAVLPVVLLASRSALLQKAHTCARNSK
jgi:hypothetical protein